MQRTKKNSKALVSLIKKIKREANKHGGLLYVIPSEKVDDNGSPGTVWVGSAHFAVKFPEFLVPDNIRVEYAGTDGLTVRSGIAYRDSEGSSPPDLGSVISGALSGIDKKYPLNFTRIVFSCAAPGGVDAVVAHKMGEVSLFNREYFEAIMGGMGFGVFQGKPGDPAVFLNDNGEPEAILMPIYDKNLAENYAGEIDAISTCLASEVEK